METLTPPLRAVVDVASRQPGLSLLVLHGSRARNEATSNSDWDFGYLSDERFDPDALRADLTRVLETEHVDLVDLERASAQLRFRAARDGQILFAVDERTFPRFWHAAVEFWCDAGPLLQHGYAAVLDKLGGT